MSTNTNTNTNTDAESLNQAIDRLAETYERDGVVSVRGLVDAARMNEIREALDRYVRQVAPTLPEAELTYEPDGRSVRNLWRMHEHDEFFRELGQDPALRELIARLVRGEPVLMAVETFNKPAKVGTGVPAHQDNAYFCQAPPDVLTAWIAVDPVTTENGPVSYVRGSHRLGTLAHKPSGVAGNSMGLDADYDARDPFVGTLDSGDALIHHCQTIHFSDRNRTDRARCGLLMVFRGSHTQTDPELKRRYGGG